MMEIASEGVAWCSCGPYHTNAWLLYDHQRAIVIDPAPGSTDRLLQFAAEQGAVIEKILITHSHWDHIADCHPMVLETQAPVWVHEEDAPNLKKPGVDRLQPHWPGTIVGVEPTGFLKEGQTISLGKFELEVIHTPGHSPGSVCLYDRNHHYLFVGDLVFRHGMGSLSLPTAEPERMWGSLEKIGALPEETIIFSGHGEKTRVGDEPWLKAPQARFGVTV